MPQLRTLPISFLLAAALLATANVYAENAKDASQQTQVQQTQVQLTQVQPATALDRINAHFNSNPKDLQAMFIRAVMLAEQNHRDEAIKAFTEITEKYPSLPEPYNNLAVLYADQGQYDKAKKALESAIKTHPSYATAHENLGDIYAKMASEAYDKALQLDTGNTRAQGKLSLIKEIFISGNKTTLVNNKLPDTKVAVKTETLPPALPVKRTEPIKPAEPVKPAELPTQTAPVMEVAKSAPTGAINDDKNTNDNKNINAAVMQWANAWSAKNVNGYLDSYADSFQVPDGKNRKEWEQTRRSRINKPEKITVDISNLHVQMQDSDHANVSFKQNYQSGSLVKRTPKTLVMKRTNGKWLIEQERTNR
jgi:tetratricopeptide (TPR) repeat protein